MIKINIVETLSLLNHYYAEKNVGYQRHALFECSHYSATQLSRLPNPSFIYRAKLILRCYNSIERFKAFVKRRAPVVKQLSIFQLSYAGETRIDLCGGTAVVIGQDVVDKFYVKDIDYFSFLYQNALSFLPMTVCCSQKALVIRQRRYHALGTGYSETAILMHVQQITNMINQRVPANIKVNHYFSVAYKIKQLFELYLGTTQGIEPYLEICHLLEKQISVSTQALCHGDLWRENIFLDQTNHIVIIDFDKMVYFCRDYDLVYFYLMNRVLPKVDLQIILENIDKYTHSAICFFAEGDEPLPDMTRRELMYCIFLFVFIKLVERDLHDERCGHHVVPLKNAMIKLTKNLAADFLVQEFQ